MMTAESWGTFYWNAYAHTPGSASLETLRKRARFNNRKGRAARARLTIPISALPKDHPWRMWAEKTYAVPNEKRVPWRSGLSSLFTTS